MNEIRDLLIGIDIGKEYSIAKAGGIFHGLISFFL